MNVRTMLTVVSVISRSTCTCVVVHQVVTCRSMFTWVTGTLINIWWKYQENIFNTISRDKTMFS